MKNHFCKDLVRIAHLPPSVVRDATDKVPGPGGDRAALKAAT